jgi:predicted DNA binding CopG/RHH family protein
MKKKLPELRSDDEAAEFIEKADLTEYDLSDLRTVRFEFQPKSERVNMRLPRPLLDAVKNCATQAGVPYQRFIRHALEAAVQQGESPGDQVRRKLAKAGVSEADVADAVRSARRTSR